MILTLIGPPRPLAAAAAAVLVAAASTSAQPVVTSVNPATTTPSGLITILGSGFGADPSVGSVEVGGREAIVTTWRDDRLKAYVPEAAPIGVAGVQVFAPWGASNVVSVSVEPRHADGRVRWRFEFDANYPAPFLAVAPGGTVYVVNYSGYPDIPNNLFAIAPNGALLWSALMPDGWMTLPISLLDDGGIVVGSGDEIRAFNPDGSVRWTFTYDSGGLQELIEVGPEVGPDGNIYGATSIENGAGLGAFSLTPDGELRWTNGGDPQLIIINCFVTTRLAFTDVTFYFPWEVICSPLPQVFGFEFGGAQITHFIQASYPRADFLGRVLYFNGGTFGDLTAIDATSGEVAWTADAHHYPVVDSQSNVYTSLQATDLHVVSYAPDGSTRWVSAEADHVYKMLAVSSDDTSVLYAGSEPDNPPDFVTSISADDGSVEWSVPLRPMIPYNDEEIVWSEEAVYSPDGATAYFTTWTDNNARVPALWAVAAGEGGPGDLDGDGTVSVADLLALLAAWGDCPGPPEQCPADLDGDGNAGVTDLLILLGHWS